MAAEVYCPECLSVETSDGPRVRLCAQHAERDRLASENAAVLRTGEETERQLAEARRERDSERVIADAEGVEVDAQLAHVAVLKRELAEARVRLRHCEADAEQNVFTEKMDRAALEADLAEERARAADLVGDWARVLEARIAASFSKDRRQHDAEMRAGEEHDVAQLRAIGALEADLAAKRGALKDAEEFFDALRRITTSASLWEMVCTNYPDQVHRAIAAALASSPGAAVNNVVACVNCKQPVQVSALNAIRCEACVAAWLATAREVVEALNQIVSVDRSAGACDDCMDGEGLCNQHADKWLAAMLVARALLARPEVKAWAGR